MSIPLSPFCSQFFTLSFSNVRHLRVHKSLPQIDSVDTEPEATTLISCKLNVLINIYIKKEFRFAKLKLPLKKNRK